MTGQTNAEMFSWFPSLLNWYKYDILVGDHPLNGSPTIDSGSIYSQEETTQEETTCSLKNVHAHVMKILFTFFTRTAL